MPLCLNIHAIVSLHSIIGTVLHSFLLLVLGLIGTSPINCSILTPKYFAKGFSVLARGSIASSSNNLLIVVAGIFVLLANSAPVIFSLDIRAVRVFATVEMEILSLMFFMIIRFY